MSTLAVRSSACRSRGAHKSQPHRQAITLEALEQRALLSAVLDSTISAQWPVLQQGYSTITAGPDGNMWCIRSQGTGLARVTPTGVITQFDLPLDPSQSSQRRVGPSLTTGSDGRLWFSIYNPNDATYQIATMTPTGQFAEVSPAQPVAISDLTTGPDGNVWYTQSNNKIASITPQGQITEFTIAQIRSFTHITTGPDGNIWFVGHGVEPNSNRTPAFDVYCYGNGLNIVGNITPQGDIHTFTTTDRSYYLIDDITAGSDGNLYFARPDGLARVTPAGVITNIPTPDLAPLDLTTGPDGALWFIDQRSVLNPLVRMGMDQTLTKYAIATPYADINTLTTGPASTLWFTQNSSDQVGKVDLQQGLLATAKRLNVDHKKEFTENVASFTDPLGTGNPVSYFATIDWGDGNISPGEIVANDHGGFDVIGSNSYTFGWHSIKITIADPTTARSTTITSMAYAVAPPIAGKGTTIQPQAGRTFTGVVGTYVGLDTDLLSRYSATIYWGDDDSSPATLSARSDGVVDVIGSHTYLKPGQYDIQVYVNEPCDTGYITPWPIYINHYAIDDTFRTINPVINDIQPLPVGSSATLGTTNPSFSTSPTLTSTTTSQYITSDYYRPVSTSNDARSRAVVSPGILDGDILPTYIITGLPFDGPIAKFTCANPKEDISHYYAVVQWNSSSQQPVRGTIKPDGYGSFTVSISRLFLRSDYTPVTVKIYDDRLGEQGGTFGVATGTLSIASHLSVTALPFSATAGQEFTGVVGHFSSLGTGTLWSSAFEATIHWGDGQESKGQIVPLSDGTYDIVGTHTYQITGFDLGFDISLFVYETRTPLDPSLPKPETPYEGYAYTRYQACHLDRGSFDTFFLRVDWTPSVTVGQPSQFTFATIALANPQPQEPSDFTGSILWDDGTTSPVFFSPNDAYTLRVSTSHIFTTEGTHKGTLTVTCQGTTRSADVRTYAYKYNPGPVQTPLAEVQVYPLLAIRGVEFAGIVGKFKPIDLSIPIDQYKANICWGDGDSSQGIITPGPDGYYYVSAAHTYIATTPEPPTGDHQYVNVIVCAGSRLASNYAELTVKLDPTRVNADGRNDMHFRQREQFTSKVATFTSPLRNATPELYQATIDWGDGTTSQGVITAGYQDTLEIAGTKTYSKSGPFTITVTITGPGGPVTTRSCIRVDRDPVAVTPGQPIVHGGQVSGQLATFIDEDGKSTNPDLYRVSHAGLVDWGDGTVTWSLITENTDGTYSVAGSHSYLKDGDYLVRLVVRRNTRYLPTLTRWFSPYDSRGICDFGVVGASANSANGSPNGNSEEYSTALFTVHVTLPTDPRPKSPHYAPAPPPVAKQTPQAPLAASIKRSATRPAPSVHQRSSLRTPTARHAIQARAKDTPDILAYRWKRASGIAPFSRTQRVYE